MVNLNLSNVTHILIIPNLTTLVLHQKQARGINSEHLPKLFRIPARLKDVENYVTVRASNFINFKYIYVLVTASYQNYYDIEINTGLSGGSVLYFFRYGDNIRNS